VHGAGYSMDAEAMTTEALYEQVAAIIRETGLNGVTGRGVDKTWIFSPSDVWSPPISMRYVGPAYAKRLLKLPFLRGSRPQR